MSEFDRELETRALQSDLRVLHDNWLKLERWGAYNIVKVVNLEKSPQADRDVSRYVGLLTALSGLTPAQMRDMLGLRMADLADGACIYQLSRVPAMNEFVVRGYTTLVDGKRLKPGLMQDNSGYRPGHGAYQIALTVSIRAALFAILRPGERFVVPVHPKHR